MRRDTICRTYMVHMDSLNIGNLYLWISRAISCMNSRLQFYEPCSALGEFPLIMRFLSFEFITARWALIE